MAYSNGYNLTTVLPALFGRLAWSTDSTLNAANETSASGRYFDDGSFHSLVTVANIKAATPTPADWDTYFIGKQNAIISKCLNSVFNLPEFVDQVKVFDADDSEIEDLIDNSGKAVGYKISVARDYDKSAAIKSLELYFDGAATFNVYLFKQGQKTALQTKSVATVANQKVSVSLTDWVLNYREAGTYYVLYFQDDLGAVKAIQQQGCVRQGCFFDARPVLADVVSGTEFDRDGVSEPSLPYGLNLQINSLRDFTSNILNQPHLFDELLGLTMAYSVVEQIIYTVQSNASERILKDQLDRVGIQMDLNGSAPISDSPQVIGLRQRIERETKRVRQAFYHRPKAQTVEVC